MQNFNVNEALSRTRLLLGEEPLAKLAEKSVLLFGLGGVGGFALEALVRAGVGRVAIVDYDTVSVSNLNRQIIADTTTLGRPKTDVAAERALLIRPDVEIVKISAFVSAETIPQIMEAAGKPDYIIDAIDTVSAKLALAEYATAHGIPIIASMGAGNRLDPTRFQIADIAKTSICPLARVMRRELRARGIRHYEVLYSTEPPRKVVADTPGSTRHAPGSVSFVPPVAGMILAGHVVKKLAGIGA